MVGVEDEWFHGNEFGCEFCRPVVNGNPVKMDLYYYLSDYFEYLIR